VITTYKPTADIDVITSSVAIPGLGLVPVNAFVLHGPEPILVDTGTIIDRDEFMTTLRSVIDPVDLKWIWLTHPDFDHIGALAPLLAGNPQVRVVTTFLGVGIMGLYDPLPLDRVYLLNPGQKITIGGRTLTAVKPAVFDNPSTTGFLDDGSGILFSSDCFGACLPAVPENAADLSADELRQGQVLWATVDSPWVHRVDATVYEAELNRMRAIEPTMVLSSHLPAAPGTMLERFLASLAAVPAAAPFVGPDQAMLQQMLAQMSAGGQQQ
jgi:Metallo-beta-lactamase superfamily